MLPTFRNFASKFKSTYRISNVNYSRFERVKFFKPQSRSISSTEYKLPDSPLRQRPSSAPFYVALPIIGASIAVPIIYFFTVFSGKKHLVDFHYSWINQDDTDLKSEAPSKSSSNTPLARCQTLNLTLYGSNSSGPTYILRAFLDYYGIPYRYLEVNPLRLDELYWTRQSSLPVLAVSHGIDNLEHEREFERAVQRERKRYSDRKAERSERSNSSKSILSMESGQKMSFIPPHSSSYLLVDPVLIVSQLYSLLFSAEFERLDKVLPLYPLNDISNIKDFGELPEWTPGPASKDMFLWSALDTNRYALMFGHVAVNKKIDKLEGSEEMKWREWAERSLYPILMINAHRNLYQSFCTWRARVGYLRTTTAAAGASASPAAIGAKEWLSLGLMERATLVCQRAWSSWWGMRTDVYRTAPTVASHPLHSVARRHALRPLSSRLFGWLMPAREDRVTSHAMQLALYETLASFVRQLGGRAFLGGSQPNLADLTIYGTLREYEGTPLFDELHDVSPPLRDWYERTRNSVEKHEGRVLLTRPNPAVKKAGWW